MENSEETVYLGSGCFWCSEAVFERINGVESVTSGYSGGHIQNPSYHQVCSGKSGHIEVIRLIYRPAELSFDKVLDIYFSIHDPTSVDRQGNDVGPQYKSVIFYTTAKQRDKSIAKIRDLDQSGIFKKKIVTEVREFKVFYPAEEYHIRYYDRNKDAPYCRFIIEPKLSKIFNGNENSSFSLMRQS